MKRAVASLYPKCTASVIDLGPRPVEWANMVTATGTDTQVLHAYRGAGRRPLCAPFSRVERGEAPEVPAETRCSVCVALAATATSAWNGFGHANPGRLVAILDEVDQAVEHVRVLGCALCGTRGRLKFYTLSNAPGARPLGPAVHATRRRGRRHLPHPDAPKPTVAYGLCLRHVALPGAQVAVAELFASTTSVHLGERP